MPLTSLHFFTTERMSVKSAHEVNVVHCLALPTALLLSPGALRKS